MRSTVREIIAVLLAGAALAACTKSSDMSLEKPQTDKVVLVESAMTPLLDSTLSQWHPWKSTAPQTGWTYADGVLTKTDNASDLQSVAQYGNFILEFDWMLAEGGNAGVFYRVTEEYDRPYWTGPEYQLLDDARHPDGKDTTRRAAAAYAIYPATHGVVKPAMQWNAARIVVSGNHVEHWLNGQKVVEYELQSADWAAKVKASKFVEYPNYGLASRGYLSIQGDHEGQLSIRAMRIRELP